MGPVAVTKIYLMQAEVIISGPQIIVTSRIVRLVLILSAKVGTFSFVIKQENGLKRGIVGPHGVIYAYLSGDH
ncbi:hypothetical protein DGG96_19125 [Legionella qingyii]|uniref:Uncharacterized protein n=1 Tax=Legionella qingyii TaxID=2184757 RepID=A0A317TZY7_9GAMM|nr:hypothetical protein DGG96_19125 [Legionella qingyii]